MLMENTQVRKDNVINSYIKIDWFKKIKTVKNSNGKSYW